MKERERERERRRERDRERERERERERRIHKRKIPAANKQHCPMLYIMGAT